MEKIPDIHNYWKFWSVRLSFASGVISATALGIIGAYAMLPSDWLPEIPSGFKQTVSYAALGSAALTAFLAALARGYQQPKLQQPKE